MRFDTDAPPTFCTCGDDARPRQWYRPGLAACIYCGGLFQASQHQHQSHATRAGVSSKTRTRKWDPARKCYVPFRPLLGAA